MLPEPELSPASDAESDCSTSALLGSPQGDGGAAWRGRRGRAGLMAESAAWMGPQPALNRVSVSTLRTFINVCKTFVGAASLELPSAIRDAGLVSGTLGLVLLAVMSGFTLELLARDGHLASSLLRTRLTQQRQSADLEAEDDEQEQGHELTGLTSGLEPHETRMSDEVSYPAIGGVAFGTAGAFVAWFGILTMTVGVCGSYFVFIGTSLSCILAPHMEVLDARVCTLLVLPVVLLLSLFRSLKFLAPASLLGVVVLLCALLVSLADAATNHSLKALDSYPAVRPGGFPLFLGKAAFLYLIHSTILPTEQAMDNPRRFPITVRWSILAVTLVNVCYCVPVYMLLGDSVADNSISSISNPAYKTIVRVFLSVDLICTTALFLFPVSRALEQALLDTSRFEISTFVEMQRNLLRATLIAVIATVGYAVPHFGLLTGLSGGLGNNVVGFILPPIFYVRLRHLSDSQYWSWRAVSSNSARAFELCCCILTTVFGFGMLIYTTQSFAEAISSAHGSSDRCY